VVPGPSGLADLEREKRAAAQAAAALVAEGAAVGLGTGSTVAYLIPALARRTLTVRCVATSIATERKARELGLDVGPFDSLERLDIAIDGADQIAPDGWLVKGGGGAHVREKIVAQAAERFVIIASSNKVVDRLRGPVPLELIGFGLAATLRRLGHAALRDGAPPSPDGGLIADYRGPVGHPGDLAARLAATAGVIDHGLFAPELVTDILVAHGDQIEHRTL
jgi:ribose 5-phosphate isomerase A